MRKGKIAQRSPYLFIFEMIKSRLPYPVLLSNLTRVCERPKADCEKASGNCHCLSAGPSLFAQLLWAPAMGFSTERGRGGLVWGVDRPGNGIQIRRGWGQARPDLHAGFPQSNIDQTRSEHPTIVFLPSSVNLL